MLEKLANRQWDEVREGLLEMHPSEAADAIGELPAGERAVAYRLLPEAAASGVFGYLDSRTQQSIIKNLGKREVAAILDEMSPDDRTVSLEKLPPRILKDTVNLLSDEGAAGSGRLLSLQSQFASLFLTEAP